jgi:hypothetical protein
VNGNIADLLDRTLAAPGVHRIYGIVGDSLNGVTEASVPAAADRATFISFPKLHKRSTPPPTSFSGTLSHMNKDWQQPGYAPSKPACVHERFGVSERLN